MGWVATLDQPTFLHLRLVLWLDGRSFPGMIPSSLSGVVGTGPAGSQFSPVPVGASRPQPVHLHLRSPHRPASLLVNRGEPVVSKKLLSPCSSSSSSDVSWLAGIPSNRIAGQASIILFFFVESVRAATYIAPGDREPANIEATWGGESNEAAFHVLGQCTLVHRRGPGDVRISSREDAAPTQTSGGGP